MDNSPITYLLDKRKNIVSVGGPWDQFAQENGGECARGCEVCGHSIWKFVTGDLARMWLDTVFQLALARGETIERPYRCDSPLVKRFMRMRIRPGEGGLLHVEHELLATEVRPASVFFRFAAKGEEGGARLRCSICGRISLAEGWHEPGEQYAAPSTGILVVYSVCPDCERSVAGK